MIQRRLDIPVIAKIVVVTVELSELGFMYHGKLTVAWYETVAHRDRDVVASLAHDLRVLERILELLPFEFASPL